ncbi:Com family DNA-binding transcriptional regulator [Pseudomonas sp. NFXW11]|uniref:Com family DNA-binding transcriptional regulator n=1 Tax=Pseudomonas sp. NFXW11 TaxID=2819531 RepID=UPI003CF628E7
MLKEYRCGHCKRLLARVGEFTELQIKCTRCATLNHVRGTSFGKPPACAEQASSGNPE